VDADFFRIDVAEDDLAGADLGDFGLNLGVAEIDGELVADVKFAAVNAETLGLGLYHGDGDLAHNLGEGDGGGGGEPGLDLSRGGGFGDHFGLRILRLAKGVGHPGAAGKLLGEALDVGFQIVAGIPRGADFAGLGLGCQGDGCGRTSRR